MSTTARCCRCVLPLVAVAWAACLDARLTCLSFACCASQSHHLVDGFVYELPSCPLTVAQSILDVVLRVCTACSTALPSSSLKAMCNMVRRGTLPVAVTVQVLTTATRIADLGTPQQDALRESGWVALLAGLLQRYMHTDGREALIEVYSDDESRAKLSRPSSLMPKSRLSTAVFGMLSFVLAEFGGKYEGSSLSLQAQGGSIRGLGRHLSHANISNMWAAGWVSLAYVVAPSRVLYRCLADALCVCVWCCGVVSASKPSAPMLGCPVTPVMLPHMTACLRSMLRGSAENVDAFHEAGGVDAAATLLPDMYGREVRGLWQGDWLASFHACSPTDASAVVVVGALATGWPRRA